MIRLYSPNDPPPSELHLRRARFLTYCVLAGIVAMLVLWFSGCR